MTTHYVRVSECDSPESHLAAVGSILDDFPAETRNVLTVNVAGQCRRVVWNESKGHYVLLPQ